MQLKIKVILILKTLAITVFALILVNCKKATLTPTDKFIESFSFPIIPNDSITTVIDNKNHLLLITVPPNLSLKNLTPTIKSSTNTQIQPFSGISQDFSQQITYKLTGTDGTSVMYQVKIQIRDSEILYIGSSDAKLYAIYAITGLLKWTSKTNGPILGSPTYDNGMVFIGDKSLNMYAFDAQNGQLKWTFDPNIEYNIQSDQGIDCTPVTANGLLYFHVGTDLYALDQKTGNKVWQSRLNSNSRSSPTVSDGIVYTGNGFGTLYAVDAKTGIQKWTYQMGYEDPTYHFFKSAIVSNPAVIHGNVFVTSTDSSIYSLNAKSGNLNWKFKTDDIIESSPTISNGKLYVGGNDGNLYVLDEATGKLKWTFTPYEQPNWITSSPIVDNNALYFCSNYGLLFSLNANNGFKNWQAQIGNSTISDIPSPLVYSNNVYVGGGGSYNVYSINSATGVKNWVFKTGGTLFSSPILLGKNNNSYYSGISGNQQ